MTSLKLIVGVIATISILGMGYLTHADTPSHLPRTEIKYSMPPHAPTLPNTSYGTTLTTSDRSYIIAVTAASILIQECGATINVEGAIRFADQIGANAYNMSRAAGASIAAISGEDYKHEDIIPEVSTVLMQTMQELATGFKIDRAKTCAKWTTQLKSFGVIK